MKEKKKSLQKFTEFEKKADALLRQDQITREDVCRAFGQEDGVAQFFALVGKKINEFKGVDRDAFLEKIDPLLFTSQKNQLWVWNHAEITRAISKLMQEYGRMPNKNELANETGLSRQTIHKHLKEYVTHPEYLSEVEQFRFMTSKVLAKVFTFAVNGDMKAARLYLNVIGNLNGQDPNKVFIQQQNNYIQINGTILSQETLKQLKPEQLTLIESIIKKALPPIQT